MAIRDTWRRALEYFGLVEGDYIEEGQYYEERHGLRDGDRRRPPSPRVRPLPSARCAAAAAAGRRDDDIDDIFGDEDSPTPRRGAATARGDLGAPWTPVAPRRATAAATSRCTWSRRAASTTPSRWPTSSRRSKPVIINLQSHRPRALQAPDRLLLRHDLRARRRHAADRAGHLPAHARRTWTSPPRRRPGSSRAASSTSPSCRSATSLPLDEAVGFVGAGNMAERDRARLGARARRAGCP